MCLFCPYQKKDLTVVYRISKKCRRNPSSRTCYKWRIIAVSGESSSTYKESGAQRTISVLKKNLKLYKWKGKSFSETACKTGAGQQIMLCRRENAFFLSLGRIMMIESFEPWTKLVMIKMHLEQLHEYPLYCVLTGQKISAIFWSRMLFWYFLELHIDHFLEISLFSVFCGGANCYKGAEVES